jgi:hypothetical protein
MIVLNVENVSYNELIEIINTRQFTDMDEFDQFLKDYIKNIISTVKTDLEYKHDKLCKIKCTLDKINSNKMYNEVMESIDEDILNRHMYFEKIEKKYKYKGRYHYGNTSRTSRHTETKDDKQC